MESLYYNIISREADREMRMALSEHCRKERTSLCYYLVHDTDLWHPPDRTVVMVFSSDNLHVNPQIYTYNIPFGKISNELYLET